MVLTFNKVSWMLLTRSLMTLQRNILKRTWWVKVLPPPNCVLGQSTSLLSTESSRKSDHFKFPETRPTKSLKLP
jgi:hypothetical protein